MKLVKEECVRGDVLAEIKKRKAILTRGRILKKCSGGFFFHGLPIYVIMTFEKLGEIGYEIIVCTCWTNFVLQRN